MVGGGALARGQGRWREDRPGAAWGGAGADGWEVRWRGAPARSRCVGGAEAGLRVRCVRTGTRWTYGGPGLLVCSFFLSRLAFLSSSVFLQCLFSFRLICLECKRQGVFL